MATLTLPEPYDFDVSTVRYRAFGPDLANLWHEGGLHRVFGGREVRIEAAPGGVDVSPLDDATEPVVRHYLGGAVRPRKLLRVRGERPRACAPRPPAARTAPTAQPRPVRDARDVDHRAAGLALFGVRSAQPPDRALRRPGRARLVVSDRGAAGSGGRGGADRGRLLAPQGGVRDRHRPRGGRLGRARGASGRRGEGPARGAPRPRGVDGRLVPGPPSRAAARLARRRPRAREGSRRALPRRHAADDRRGARLRLAVRAVREPERALLSREPLRRTKV